MILFLELFLLLNCWTVQLKIEGEKVKTEQKGFFFLGGSEPQCHEGRFGYNVINSFLGMVNQ